ncbi:hypothetical protein CCR75_008401 [Bremia lactucae]|uniref:Uncharacterized protein n=1 Tax=Bremia lactucae TaxID=4779 RepID=A0A976FK40_BRELC|nr:hypothetical protein CCR75_008401 [Bremia lactucae]
MLAYALSRPSAKSEIPNVLAIAYPSPPPNSPLLVAQDDIVPIENEVDDQYDIIDFSRVRAELDRLLEEGLFEPNEAESQSTNN